MPLVDDPDSGGILGNISEDELLQLSRTLSYNDAEYMHHLLNLFLTCTSMEQIYDDEVVLERMELRNFRARNWLWSKKKQRL